jgi:integrase
VVTPACGRLTLITRGYACHKHRAGDDPHLGYPWRYKLNRDVEDFLASFPFAETTKDSYRRTLDQLILLDLDGLTAAGLIGFVTRPGWGSSTRYVALCACRKFIGWLYGQSHPALTARVKQSSPRPQRVLSVASALDLLASFDTFTPKGRRDLSMAALMLDTGLRCSEICRLRIADTDLATRTLQVIVKGGQWGRAVYSQQTALYLADWLAVRQSSALTMFVNLRFGFGANNKAGDALTRDGLKVIVRDWGRALGLKLSPHDFRRSFATLSTIFGAPSRVVQKAGRWSEIDMVERYTASLQADEIVPYLPVTRLQVHTP